MEGVWLWGGGVTGKNWGDSHRDVRCDVRDKNYKRAFWESVLHTWCMTK